MKKRKILIPGEKKKIKEEFAKARKEQGPLTSEQKKEIAKQVHKKMKKRATVVALLAALGITTVGVGVKAIEEPKQSSTSEQTKEFKETYTVSTKSTPVISNSKTKQEQIAEIVNNLESKEDILHFLKDKYIEQYEKNTGDSTLTTEDIKLIANYENYVFIDKNTGNMYLHGETPDVTEQKLKNEEISYTSQDNVKVYKVIKDNKVIDCITLQSKDGKNVPITVNSIDNQSPSILKYMGESIPKGIDYAENIEDDLAKKQFINALIQEQEKQQEQKER